MKRPVLWLALACHLAFATGYLLRTPAFEGPDENGHAYYASFLANRGSLPLIENSADGTNGSARDESPMGHHPPLYYGVLALTMAATGSADTVPTWSLASPGGTLQWRHGYDELAPVSDEIGLLRILRAWSVAFGLVTILLTWRLASLAFPQRLAVADGAALLLACLPQFSFMHGVLNCGNLATMLSHGVLAVLAAGLCARRLTLPAGAGLGALCGAALLTKMTCLFLLPLLVGAYLLALWRWPGQRGQTLLSGLTFGLITLSVSGWFFLRNLELYGELLARTAIRDITSDQLVPEGQRWEYLSQFFLPELWRSFVGYFGWWRLPAPAWVLAGWVALTGLSAVGWIGAFRRGFRPTAAVWVLLFAAVLLFGSVLRLNLLIASPQGRYLFPAAGPVLILITAGLLHLGARLPPGLRAGSGRTLVPVPPLVALFVLQLHFTPAFRIPAPEDPHHASLIAEITSPPEEFCVELLEPANGAAVLKPPTFRWSVSGDEPFGLHLYDTTGEIWLSTEQHGLRLRRGRWEMPSDLFDTLPGDRELFWKVRRLPDRTRRESAKDVPASPSFGFRLKR